MEKGCSGLANFLPPGALTSLPNVSRSVSWPFHARPSEIVSFRLRHSILALSLVLLAASAAEAEEPRATKTDVASPAEGSSGSPTVTPQRRALSAGAAVIPGVIVHGTGHYVLGETRTGNRLLLAEGVGLGMFLGGGATVFATGASRYVVGPAAAVAVVGFGLFATSFLADVYGTLSPDAGAAGKRLYILPFIETEVGYRYINDPQFAYRNFIVESVSMRADRFRVTPSGWFSTTGDSARYRLEAAYRFAGALPRKQPRDLSSLDVVAAGVHHRYETVGFGIWSGEVAALGRYDLQNIGPTLRGAFVEGGLGLGHQWIVYDLPGLDVPADDEALLLARFGFGVVLRGRAAPGSEVLAYYDHRHDDYAGGFLMPGLTSGVLGRLGIGGRWYFNRSLGVLVDAHAGAAIVAGASLLLRE